MREFERSRFRERYAGLVASIEHALAERIAALPSDRQPHLLRALYLGQGGTPSKRMRGVFALLLGSKSEASLRWATAIEFAHAASLVADDLQDEHEGRQGFPSLWKIAGRAEALNQIVLLLAIAIGVLEREPLHVRSSFRTAIEGMVLGQQRDLEMQRSDGGLGEYLAVAARKTGGLFRFSAEAALFQNEALSVLERLVDLVAYIHQIRDDLDDASPSVHLLSSNVVALMPGDYGSRVRSSRELVEDFRGQALGLLDHARLAPTTIDQLRDFILLASGCTSASAA